MNINIRELSDSMFIEAVKSIEAELPIWLTKELIDCYRTRLILSAYSGKELCGIWIVPLSYFENEIIVKREYRYLPYCSPYVLKKEIQEKREITLAFFRYIKSRYNRVYIPMDPTSVDMSSIQGLGMFVEWRHTHIMQRNYNPNSFTPMVKRNIRTCKQKVSVEFSTNIDNFNFEQAIHGTIEEIEKRKMLANKILEIKKGVIVFGKEQEKINGGIFIAFDKNYSYLLHSWREKTSSRGIINLLISEGINWVFQNTTVENFDFEGSVIQSVDRFYAGFDGEIKPYGFIHWANTDEKLFQLINRSINIDGRLIK